MSRATRKNSRIGALDLAQKSQSIVADSGTWNSTTTYTAGQVVTYSSGRYLTPLGAPASAAFDLTRWVLIGALGNTI